MSTGISILCPTRGRPDGLDELIATAKATAAGPIQLVIYVDDDDESMADWNGDAHVIRGPRILLSEAWNRCAERATFNVMMHCGDDIRFRTPGWDWQVLEAFRRYPDRIVLVHGRDGIHDEAMATHGFLHRRWVDTIGCFVPPYFSSDYNDLWLTEVADALDRRHYLHDVYTEHLHPAVGKAPIDRTHEERMARHAADDCDRIWRNTRQARDEWVTKLRAAIR